MEEVHVVTCFLEYDNRVLLLKRSQKVGTYEQRWAGVSGYIEEGNSPFEQALEEMREEAGLKEEDIRLLREGVPLEVDDKEIRRKWVVHPFRFLLSKPEKVELDWEHTEFKWVKPEEIKKHKTVPGLYEAWERVV